MTHLGGGDVAQLRGSPRLALCIGICEELRWVALGRGQPQGHHAYRGAGRVYMLVWAATMTRVTMTRLMK
jgi:hypothetical protein